MPQQMAGAMREDVSGSLIGWQSLYVILTLTLHLSALFKPLSLVDKHAGRGHFQSDCVYWWAALLNCRLDDVVPSGFESNIECRSCRCQPSVLGRGSFLCAIPGVGSGFGSRSDWPRSLRIALPSVQTADGPLTRFMTNTTDSMAVQYSPYDGFKIIAGCSL